MSEMWSVISIERVQLEYIVTENAKCIEFVVDLKPLFFTRSHLWFLHIQDHCMFVFACHQARTLRFMSNLAFEFDFVAFILLVG